MLWDMEVEDRLMPFMDKFVLKKYGIKAQIVERKFVVYPDGKHDEVNL